MLIASSGRSGQRDLDVPGAIAIAFIAFFLRRRPSIPVSQHAASQVARFAILRTQRSQFPRSAALCAFARFAMLEA
jgi:hypothetical protein